MSFQAFFFILFVTLDLRFFSNRKFHNTSLKFVGFRKIRSIFQPDSYLRFISVDKDQFRIQSNLGKTAQKGSILTP